MARIGFRRQFDDRWHTWQVRRYVLRDLRPPAHASYAHFGLRSVVVGPARVVDPHCISIGDDTIILEHAWLSVQDRHSTVATRLTIGDRVRIGRAFSIACIGTITVGDDVMMSDGVFIADCYHDYHDPDTPVLHQPMSAPEPVVIGAGAFLGAGSVVLQGVTVGEGAYVGEGAVVTDDVAPHTVVYGNPARVVRRYDEATSTWVGAATEGRS